MTAKFNVRELQKDTDAKALLAKLLATENLNIEIRKVETAFFDLDTRILVIPQYREDLPESVFNLFISHEVSHALHTNFKEWMKGVEEYHQGCVNIIEDIRIEKLIQRKYPGFKSDYRMGYKWLWENDFFGVKNTPWFMINFLDRLNVYAKCGPDVGISFYPDEQPIVDKIFSPGSLETWDDTIHLCQMVIDFIKERIEKQEQEQEKDSQDHQQSSSSSQEPMTDENTPEFDLHAPQPPDPNDSSEEGDGADGDAEKSSDKQESTTEKGGKKKEGDTQEESESKEEDNVATSSGKGGENETDASDENDSEVGGETGGDNEENDENNPTESAPKSPNKTFEEEMESKTDAAAEVNKNSFVSGENFTKIANVVIPEVDATKTIIPQYEKLVAIYNRYVRNSSTWKEEAEREFERFKKYSGSNLSYLTQQFMLKKNANEMSLVTTQKSGHLNTKAIPYYQLKTDIFRKNLIQPKGQSHGLVLFMDWSGSMENNLKHSLYQLFEITDFCRKVKIPFDVYCFQDKGYGSMTRGLDQEKIVKDYQKRLNGMILFNPAILNHILSHKISGEDYRKIQATMLKLETDRGFGQQGLEMGLHGTPLDQTIIAAMSIVPKFQQDNRLDIVNTIFITDGESECLRNYENKISCGTSYFYVRSDVVYWTHQGTKYQISNKDFRFTNKNHKVNSYPYHYTTPFTYYLLKMLERVTKTNVIGFFLGGPNELNKMLTRENAYRSHFNKPQVNRSKEDGFYTVYHSGYSEGYIINADNFSIQIDTTQNIKDFNRLRKSRVMLTKFIDMIAEKSYK